MINATPLTLIHTLVTAILGMVALSSSLIGYLAAEMKFIERIILFAAGLLMIIPDTLTDIIGLAVLIICIVLQRRRKI